MNNVYHVPCLFNKLFQKPFELHNTTFDVVAAKDELTWTGEAESIPDGKPERFVK